MYAGDHRGDRVNEVHPSCSSVVGVCQRRASSMTSHTVAAREVSSPRSRGRCGLPSIRAGIEWLVGPDCGRTGLHDFVHGVDGCTQGSTRGGPMSPGMDQPPYESAPKSMSLSEVSRTQTARVTTPPRPSNDRGTKPCPNCRAPTRTLPIRATQQGKGRCAWPNALAPTVSISAVGPPAS